MSSRLQEEKNGTPLRRNDAGLYFEVNIMHLCQGDDFFFFNFVAFDLGH